MGGGIREGGGEGRERGEGGRGDKRRERWREGRGGER